MFAYWGFVNESTIYTHYENIKHIICLVYICNICTHLVLSSVSNPSVNDWVQCLAWGFALQITNFMEHGKAAFFPLNVSGTVQKAKKTWRKRASTRETCRESERYSKATFEQLHRENPRDSQDIETSIMALDTNRAISWPIKFLMLPGLLCTPPS